MTPETLEWVSMDAENVQVVITDKTQEQNLLQSVESAFDYTDPIKENKKRIVRIKSSKTYASHIVAEEQGVKFWVDEDTWQPFVDFNGEQLPVTKEIIDQIKKSLSVIRKVKEDVVTAKMPQDLYCMWDTILLYGPTGTGKTHSALEWIRDKGLSHAMVTVSDGFEDIDFLTYIIPSAKGIQYKEKEIVSLLRKAEAWENVAILIDEVNRGSKSFMNLLLKMLDPVTGMYEVNNFVKDEVIKIPKENVIFFCTANLGGGYSGTNDLDEALFDRFNKIAFIDYNKWYEAALFDNFGTFSTQVKTIVDYIRDLYKDNTLKRPISTRTIKSWTWCFINSPMSSNDLFSTFNQTVMYRLVGIDSYGNPNEQDVGIITSKFIEMWLVK